ncbi:Flp pilus assembly pilin Flp [Caulobacter sp. 1776]
MVAMVALAVVATMSAFSGGMNKVFDKISTAVTGT